MLNFNGKNIVIYSKRPILTCPGGPRDDFRDDLSKKVQNIQITSYRTHKLSFKQQFVNRDAHSTP